MKFTVERVALQRMIEQLKFERGVAGAQQRMLRLSACAARVLGRGQARTRHRPTEARIVLVRSVSTVTSTPAGSPA